MEHYRMIAGLKMILRKIAIICIRFVQKIVDRIIQDDNIHLLAPKLTLVQFQDIRNRLDFYAPGRTLIKHSHLPLLIALSSSPVLTFGEFSPLVTKFWQYRNFVFDIDQLRNYHAGWAWCYFAEYCEKKSVDISDSYSRFRTNINVLRNQRLEKIYLFGTGPSLSKAGEMDWSDGYRIVCNTIVRDRELWHKIDPHFIVAGDAIYHFSYTRFAREFRRDLARRLSETNTFFVFPAMYNSIVMRELRDYSDRLVPVPDGTHNKINVDLYEDFSLPKLGNVLPYLLLPLGCTLGRKVFLWGFDGRAPNDQLFWSNSTKHSYSELIPELQGEFPAFFDHFVPKNNPTKYVKEVHGDQLEKYLQDAESEGWAFQMMHKSWTPTLQKRFIASAAGEE
jgi:hypothetical protein